MSTPKFPHQKIMQDQGLDLKSEVLSPSTRRAIEKFDSAFADLSGFKDETRKNIATEKLNTQSPKIAEMLEDDIKAAADKAAAEKKKADDKKAADDKKTADDDDKKKASEDDKKSADDKKKADDDKNKKPADDSKKQDNPYGLSDSGLAAYKVIDKLFGEKAKNGEMVISEKDMSFAGFSPWAHLGMTTGKVGNYNFSASLMSDDWKVTKEKKDPASKA